MALLPVGLRSALSRAVVGADKSPASRIITGLIVPLVGAAQKSLFHRFTLPASYRTAISILKPNP
ncbi:TPA: hypothetical protein N2G37_003569 [Salmonella enterica]|nr:hypothetical protein [Salmonella enterica]